MPSLKLHPATPRSDLDPIPFPGRDRRDQSVDWELGLSGRRRGTDSIQHAEDALDRVENGFADLMSLLEEDGHDRPRAA